MIMVLNVEYIVVFPVDVALNPPPFLSSALKGRDGGLEGGE
jgi:hypothetical protein